MMLHADADSQLDQKQGPFFFSTEQQAFDFLHHWLKDLHNSGFLAASVDSTFKTTGGKGVRGGDSTCLHAIVHKGEKIRWAFLDKGNLPDWPLKSPLVHPVKWGSTAVSPQAVQRLLDEIVQYGENHGYPFIQAGLDSVFLEDIRLYARLKVDTNKLVKIDSIVWARNIKIAKAYLYNQIGIAPGDLYDESKLRQVAQKIKAIPFLKERKPARVLFREKDTQLVLDLEKKKASQFDGIIGFLPDPTTGKLNFTGNVELKLQNAFISRGEELLFQWKSLKGQSQDLFIQPSYPYIGGTLFGLTDEFRLLKQDTTYLNVNNKLGIRYFLSGNDFVELHYLVKASTLISTAGLAALTSLPDNGDMNAQFYGLGIKLDHLDYRLNPKKGFLLQANASVGTKTIVPNSALNPVVYQGIALHSIEYAGDLLAALFVPLGGRNVLKMQLQGAFIAGPDLLENEVYRIGGLGSLRGFDDLSIFASSYAVGTVEYRFIMDQNAFLHLFYDQAAYQDISIGKGVQDTPFGFGTGISFETKTGIFSLDYALGKQFGAAIDPRFGKIHFGLVRLF